VDDIRIALVLKKECNVGSLNNTIERSLADARLVEIG
jgi:hypothetical protein